MIANLYRFGYALFYALILLLIYGLSRSLFGVELPHAVPAATASDWINNPDQAALDVEQLARALITITQSSAVGFWATMGTVALTALYVAKKVLPLIKPLAGPYGFLIDYAWSALASTDQKRADDIQQRTQQAALDTKPLLDALRAIPPHKLPDSIAAVLARPEVCMAVQLLATADDKRKA